MKCRKQLDDEYSGFVVSAWMHACLRSIATSYGIIVFGAFVTNVLLVIWNEGK